MTQSRSAVCVSHGHWVCSKCSANGLCAKHKSSCTNTHSLWFNIVRQLNAVTAACPYGCVVAKQRSTAATCHALPECPMREQQLFTFAGKRIRGYTLARRYAYKQNGVCTATGVMIIPASAAFKVHVTGPLHQAVFLKVLLPLCDYTLTLVVRDNAGIAKCSADTPPALVEHARALWPTLQLTLP